MTFCQKMDETLEGFYRQDVSLRKLPEVDQQRLFAEWAARNKIRGQLEFGTYRWIKFVRIGAMILAGIYFISFIPGVPGFARAAFPLVVILMMVVFAFDNRKPILTQAEHGVASNPNQL